MWGLGCAAGLPWFGRFIRKFQALRLERLKLSPKWVFRWDKHAGHRRATVNFPSIFGQKSSKFGPELVQKLKKWWKSAKPRLWTKKKQKKEPNSFCQVPLLGPPWGPKIDQKFSFFAKWRSREIFSARFLWLAVFSHFWRRCGSIFGGPDPQKVMTLSGISYFFNFLKSCKK